MSRLIHILVTAALAVALAVSAGARDFTALARVDAARSSVSDDGPGLSVRLSVSQPVPWRAFTLADPPRLVMDFREIDWRGLDPDDLFEPGRATALRTGTYRPGWSRLVLDLEGPYTVAQAGMRTGAEGGGAAIEVRLVPASLEIFRARSGAPPGADWAEARPIARAPAIDDGLLMVVLDPGHGGIDPGAEAGGITEADLMLTFARELKEALIRGGGFRVVLTRTEDIFVPLDTRISVARASGADIFLSLHADAVPQGRATGATVYTLSETASDEAAAALAERHDRADLLAGVDLSNQDDVIAGVLMDIARLDTQPRSEALADAVARGIGDSVGGLHKRPRLAAGFSVLRAPDIPSALVELGFLSYPGDRDRLTSPEWRAKVARGIAGALRDWADSDAARATLVRR